MNFPCRFSLTLATALIVSLAGCASSRVQPGDWSTVVGSTWTLGKLDGKSLPVVEQPPSLELSGDGRAAGFAGVNRYFGRYESTPGGELSFGALGSTRMYRDQPPGLMEQETRYLQTLGEVDGYRLRGQQLLLMSGGKTRLIFDPDTSPATAPSPDGNTTE